MEKTMAQTDTPKIRAPRSLAEYKDKHDPASDEYTVWGFSETYGLPAVVLAKIMGVDALVITRIQRAEFKLPPQAWPRYERLCAAVQIASEFELFPIDPNKALSILALCDAIATLEKKLQAYEVATPAQVESKDF
jgi:hypothetical protein